MQFTGLINDSGETTENFPSLIKRHDYLLQLSKMLNDVISFVLVIQLLASCVLISTCGFQFILALNTRNVMIVVKSIFILLTILIQLYSYSYVGNYLKSQMDSIGYSLYSCGWYSLPTNVAKNIVLVTLKAQVPVHLTAGKFFVVNLETFMSILKTSMSYLSILRVMINT
nr:PREDICTED: odorant receptor 67c-like [Megachile rotundata]